MRGILRVVPAKKKSHQKKVHNTHFEIWRGLILKKERNKFKKKNKNWTGQKIALCMAYLP